MNRYSKTFRWALKVARSGGMSFFDAPKYEVEHHKGRKTQVVYKPTLASIGRASWVLEQFTNAWNLPLNPENIDLMASCMLMFHLGEVSDESLDYIREAVREIIQEEKEKLEQANSDA